MQITEVRIRKVESQGKLIASASVTFDNVFVVHDIRLLDGDRGIFIAMPSKKNNDGSYVDIAHPINSDFRRVLQDAILSKFNEEGNDSCAEQ